MDSGLGSTRSSSISSVLGKVAAAIPTISGSSATVSESQSKTALTASSAKRMFCTRQSRCPSTPSPLPSCAAQNAASAGWMTAGSAVSRMPLARITSYGSSKIWTSAGGIGCGMRVDGWMGRARARPPELKPGTGTAISPAQGSRSSPGGASPARVGRLRARLRRSSGSAGPSHQNVKRRDAETPRGLSASLGALSSGPEGGAYGHGESTAVSHCIGLNLTSTKKALPLMVDGKLPTGCP